ncbi:MAG: type II/IV secretion system ATPase subunit, partial [Candidatus Bathyarchaeota archaeon]
FTIRKFRPNPYTIIDLIALGTLTPQIAAYLWILVENLRSIMVSGATASGKTALLNAICMFIQPEMKVVSIEEVRELRLHENWIPMVTRPSFLPGVQEVNLYDLLRSALRQRPDYIIVGEIRGEEAYTLFQSIAVGHGGLCTLHADNVESAIKRLETRPMNIPEMMIPLMNIMVQIRRVKIGETVARRIDKIVEIREETKGEEARLDPKFLWSAESDTFKYVPPSSGVDDLFQRISEINYIPVEKLREEMVRREAILNWMVREEINSYNSVAEVVRSYHVNPDEVYGKAVSGFQGESAGGS